MSSLKAGKLLGTVVIFAMGLACSRVFAQTGGLTGKCVGEDGAPLVGYTILIERTDVKWSSKVKTNKKGEYIHIGLTTGDYKVTLMAPDGKAIFYLQKHVGLGDPTECPFDMAKERAQQKKEQESKPEYQQQEAELKQVASLKQIFDQGQALFGQKQYTEAAATFEKALPLAKDKNVSVVMGRLADTWAQAAATATDTDTRKADYAKAEDYYQKMLQANPNEASVHNNLGKLYADQGKSTEAQAEFTKAAEIDPTHAAGYYYNLGAILVNRGQMDDAAVALKKATEIDPTYAEAWYWLGMALMGKMQVKADGTIVAVPGTVEAFQTYLKLQPDGKFKTEAQASIDTLQSKETTEYKAAKKKK